MVEQGTEGREPEIMNRIVAAAKVVRGIEPAPGKVEAAQLSAVRTALEAMIAEHARRGALDGLEADDIAAIETRIATLHAHAAAIAIAAGEAGFAERWLSEAERLSRDDEQRAELAAGRRSHERFRALMHGRILMGSDRERAARATWRAILQRVPGSAAERDDAIARAAADDAIARAAAEELEAPRPLRPGDSTPTLARINGIGAGFYGRRKYWQDGSYATMHCISILWIPVYPLSGWRVRDADGGYHILAREPLPRWAQRARWVIPALVALLIAGGAIRSYLTDPERLARQRWDDAVEAAGGGDAEAALRRLDDEMARDLAHVDSERAQRAGAEIVRLAASRVARPLTAARLDEAMRVVRRYQGLPLDARTGASQVAMLAALDGWVKDLGESEATADARLALLTTASDIAPVARKAELAGQLVNARLSLAAARQADWPLEALAILVEHPSDAKDRRVVEAADQLVHRIAESPSLLFEAGHDIDLWSAATTNATERARVKDLRGKAEAGRTEAEAEGVTAKQLAEMQKQRPWDQYVQLQLAREDASAGKLDPAIARIQKLGPPGLQLRGLRFLHANLLGAQGKLDEADAMLTQLLAGRLPKFAAASAALSAAAKAAEERVRRALDTGNVPADLRSRVEAAGTDTKRHEIITQWFDEQMQTDAPLSDAREKYRALGDIVPVALASGSLKLRRAQALSGPARNAMLEDAERTFLAIQGAAEGQPEFRLALGETYARLGKTAESDAELDAVLAEDNRAMHLAVAHVYRSLGNTARAKQVGEKVFDAGGAEKESAAGLLGQLASDAGLEDEAERWLRKAGTSSYVTAALLEIEATRLERQGKAADCAAKFAEVAKIHLASANATRATGYNNAAVAYERGFDCSGDPAALRSAERTLETAYRNAPDDAIVVGNLAYVLDANGQLRVLSRHVNARALRLRMSDVGSVITALLDGPERDAVRAELAADPGIRRGAELLAQAEVLAPNSVRLLSSRFADAYRDDNLAAAEAILDRARHAKALDTTDIKDERERARRGADDARMLASQDNTRTRFEALVSDAGVAARPGLDARSRAAGLYLTSTALARLGLYRSDASLLARARTAAATAMQLWPALDTHGFILGVLIDEAGVTADGKAWLAARRLRSSAPALDRLAADHAPLADQIRASKLWAEVPAHARADHSRRSAGDLRLARLLGDAELETRARAIFDDRLLHLSFEFAVLLDPTDEVAKDDLAYLDKR